jgi:Family of unknown function (DUF5995)
MKGDEAVDLPRSIADVIARMEQRLQLLPERLSHQRLFLSTYQRTTRSVGVAITQGLFEDPDWVERWDGVFADLYLRALDAELTERGRVPRPWRLAFTAAAELPALLHVLLGINAHVNYDLPQSLIAVINEDEFLDVQLMQRRRRDHERIDRVLASRVAAEDQELVAAGGQSLVDRAFRPLNRMGTKRFLAEARQKVWHNTLELDAARRRSGEDHTVRLAELELLSAAKIDDLLRPGQVLLRLAIAGFGVTLPPPDEPRTPS